VIPKTARGIQAFFLFFAKLPQKQMLSALVWVSGSLAKAVPVKEELSLDQEQLKELEQELQQEQKYGNHTLYSDLWRCVVQSAAGHH
jgi:hypothetical protein